MKKLIFTAIIIIATILNLQAQEKTKISTASDSVKVQSDTQDEIVGFVTHEKMPSYPGGENALNQYLSKNVKYPVDAAKAGVQGRVVCQFVISEDGSISNVEVIRGVESTLDAEAVRVIKNMPKWIPGEQRGKAVSVKYTFPINFRLRDDTPQGKNQGKTKTKSEEEIMPIFPGGETALEQYIRENLKYPVEAQKAGVQGRVTCQFVVSEDGSVTDISIARSVDTDLDYEAIRLIRNMPKWIPGTRDGEAVNTRITLPINFVVQKDPKFEGQDSVEIKVEKMPEFPKGATALNQYLSNNIKYPVDAMKAGIQGRVICQFIVSKDGSITDIKVLRSVHPSLDREAVRVIKNMPKWTPGMQDGKVVNVRYTLPINFRMR